MQRNISLKKSLSNQTFLSDIPELMSLFCNSKSEIQLLCSTAKWWSC